MESTKRLKILGTFLLIVAVTVATNLATNLVTQKNEGFSDQSNQLPAGYAKFASATKALDTDFTVAAELSIHAVVHVKTKIPMRGVQRFGGNGFGDLNNSNLNNVVTASSSKFLLRKLRGRG